MSRPVDLEPFAGLMTEMPELRDTLPNDLPHHYRFADMAIGLKQQKRDDSPYSIDTVANQGAGKTVRGRVYRILFALRDLLMISSSIDDFYLKHKDLCKLRAANPGFESRGVTHDLPLYHDVYRSLMTMGDDPILVPGPYAKGWHGGDGDRPLWVTPQDGVYLTARLTTEEIVLNRESQRAPVLRLNEVTYKGKPMLLEDRMGSLIPLVPGFLPKEPGAEDSSLRRFLFDNVDNSHDLDIWVVKVGGQELIRFQTKDKLGATKEYDAAPAELPPGWRIVERRPDIIFREGWMQGLIPIEEAVFDDPSLLTSSEYRQVFRNMADIMFAKFINGQVLPQYSDIWNQRDIQIALYNPNHRISLDWRKQQEKPLQARGQGKTDQEIEDFVHYFWRSLHPNFFLARAVRDSMRTHQVMIIGNDRRTLAVTTPNRIDEVLAFLKKKGWF